MKKITALLVSALIFLTLCACGEINTPLFEMYQNPIIRNMAVSLPDEISFTFNSEGVSSSAYGIGDEEFIREFSESFVKINAVKKMKPDDFKPEFSVELFKGEESAVMNFGDECAEVISDNGTDYYMVSDFEEFLAVIKAYTKENEEAMENYDLVVNEQNIKIYAAKTFAFDENGNPTVEIYALNGGNTPIRIMLTDITVNGGKKDTSDAVYVQSGSESGFEVPVKAENADEIESVSFCVSVALGISDKFSPFIVSDAYEIAS